MGILMDLGRMSYMWDDFLVKSGVMISRVWLAFVVHASVEMLFQQGFFLLCNCYELD